MLVGNLGILEILGVSLLYLRINHEMDSTYLSEKIIVCRFLLFAGVSAALHRKVT